MIMKNTNKGMMLAVFAVVAALVVAAPAIAQQDASGQSAAAQTGAVTLDLATLQRTGPGGDLANVRQGSALGASSSTVSCPEETCYECVLLDSYNPVNTYDPNVPGSDVINTVQTANALTLGQPYVIKITGTVSYWGYTYYTAPIGSPEPHPMFLSPAVPVGQQGDVASDWEYLFAYPNNNHGNLFASGPGHIVYQGVSLDNGATFVDLVPLGGQFYSSSHVYSYLVEGQGLQAKFRISDFGPHNDNYGEYKICIYKLLPVTTCGRTGSSSGE